MGRGAKIKGPRREGRKVISDEHGKRGKHNLTKKALANPEWRKISQLLKRR